MRSDLYRQPVVLKFGGSVLPDASAIPRVVSEIYRRFRRGVPVAAVVSAFEGRTDGLVALADGIGSRGRPRAALLGVGEVEGSAAVAMGLERAGLPVELIPPERVGIIASGDACEAEPVAVEPAAVRAALSRGRIAVVPGYVARGPGGEPALLGRGGSDLTAILLADAIDANAVLIKRSGAIYERDPETPGPRPRAYERLSFDDAPALGERVLQPRAIHRAHRIGSAFAVRGFSTRPGPGTIVDAGPTRLAALDDRTARAPRLARVAIFGLGTVGAGVARRLALEPDAFEIIGALARDPDRPRPGLPAGMTITTEPAQLLSQRPDIVVELIGGTDDARDLIARALHAGADVITANKAVLAEHGPELDAVARSTGRTIRSSAAVGGAMPALERVADVVRARPVVSIRGILNGTTNFVLDRIRRGQTLDAALQLARELGLAEADATADLDGHDAARKLVLLARAIGINEIDLDTIDREPLTDAAAATVNADGTIVRQVAEMRTRDRAGVAAGVRLVRLAPGDPMASVSGARNALEIGLDSGETVTTTGVGAGRWPTTEAVVADTVDLLQRLARDPERPDLAARVGHAP